MIEDVALMAITRIAISINETTKHMISPSVQSSLKIGWTTPVVVEVVDDIVDEVFSASAKTLLMLIM